MYLAFIMKTIVLTRESVSMGDDALIILWRLKLKMVGRFVKY
jgi:hypothetical protein